MQPVADRIGEQQSAPEEEQLRLSGCSVVQTKVCGGRERREGRDALPLNKKEALDTQD